MEWQNFFQNSDVKLLDYLYAHNNSRYSDLLRHVVPTRSVLSTSLKDLRERRLVDRVVEHSSPIQTKYRLTDKGIRLTKLLAQMKKLGV